MMAVVCQSIDWQAYLQFIIYDFFSNLDILSEFKNVK